MFSLQCEQMSEAIRPDVHGLPRHCGTPGRRTGRRRSECGLRQDGRREGLPSGRGRTGRLAVREDQLTRRSPGLSRESNVSRGEAGARRKMNTDTVDRRCKHDDSAIRDRHTRTAMAAQNARSVSGLVVAGLVTRFAAPLEGVRLEVVVGRLDDGQPEDRRKLPGKRSGGGPPEPESAERPQHAGQGSPGGRHATRPVGRCRIRPLRPRRPPEPEQREPLVEGQSAWRPGRIEPEIPTQPMDLRSRDFGSQTPPDRASVATEATPDEAPVVRGLKSVHKRSGSAGEPERDDVDAGRGIEVGTAKPPRDLDLPPRLEQQRGQGLPGKGTAGKPFGRFTLDHEIGVLRWRIVLGEPPDDGGGPVEGNVPQNLVGDFGQPEAKKVGG